MAKGISFSQRGEGRMVSFHSNREFKSLWVQWCLLTPCPGFSSCTSKTRDRALQPRLLPKMSLCSWAALMWCICNQGSALGKEVHDKGLSEPLGNSSPSLGAAQALSPGPCLSHSTRLAWLHRLSIPSALGPDKPLALPVSRQASIKS